MSSNIKARPTRVPDSQLFYTQDSLSFVRSLMSELEDEIKAKAKQLILDDGRNTITEDDMRRAADEILGPVDDENVDPDVTDA